MLSSEPSRLSYPKAPLQLEFHEFLREGTLTLGKHHAIFNQMPYNVNQQLSQLTITAVQD
jgi:hypothetical protein